MSSLGYTEEQQRVIEHDNGNILVSASAGSGKTHTMITRLIRLIVQGKTTLKNVLALTFTEAAASEMKEKLRSAIIKEINATENKRLISELSEISGADISTIDAFCKRLIKKYFFKAGVSPDFGIADETVSCTLKKEALDKTFRDYYQDGDKEFLSVVDRYASNRKDGTLREIVLSIYNACSSEANEDRLISTTLYNYTEEGFYNLLKAYKDILDAKVKRISKTLIEAEKTFSLLGYDKSAEFCKTLISDTDAFINSNSVYAYAIDYNPYLSFDRKMEGDALEVKKQVTDCRDKLKKITAGVKNSLTDEETDKIRNTYLLKHTKVVFSLVKNFADNYALLKAEENLLDFADLERFTYNLLKDEEIRQSVSNGYDYIFVDEYQDVNGVQEEIINALAKDNVFMVGDVKQSIYGFRGCRPEFFEEKFRKMKNSAESTVRLSSNFRSAPEVIGMVNKVFSYSMNKEFYGVDYKNNAELIHGGLFDEEHQGRANLCFLIKEKEKAEKETPRVYDVLKEIEKPVKSEVSDTAGLIAKIIEEECGKTYYDVKEKKEKRIEFKDICVLARSINSTYVVDLIKGLKARGIRVVSDAKESIIDYPEIQVILSLLQITQNFYNDIPLATVMKSPVGCFTDEELAEISVFYLDYKRSQKISGKEKESFSDAFKYCMSCEEFPLKDKLATFYDYISRIRKLSDFISARDLLEKVIDEKNIEAFLLASNNGEEKVKRLRSLLSACVSGEKRYSVKEFLRLVKTNKDALKVVSGGSENAVKIMTIHASKGLEFPVVIVCGLEKKNYSGDEHESVIFDRNLGFATKFYNDEERTSEETLLRAVIKEKLKEQRLKEELRLFYVALTRAIYSLNLTYVLNEDTRKSEFNGADKYLDYVPLDIPAVEYTEDDLNLINNLVETRKVLISEVDEKKKEQMKENFAYEYPFIKDTTLPLKTTVTEANAKTKEEYYKVEQMFTDGETPTGAERGTIAHRVMELYDFESEKPLTKQVDEFVKNDLISEEDVNKIDLDKIEKAILGGAFNNVRGKKLYREKSFLVNLSAKDVLGIDTQKDVLIQGTIDLLGVDGRNATVIDYKYSTSSKDALNKRYKKQLDLYAKSVEKVLGLRVEEKRIINLLSGESVLID